MGLKVAGGYAGVAVLGAALLGGCQQGAGPMHMGVMSEDAAAVRAGHVGEWKDTPYENPAWQDEEPSDDLLTTALSRTGSFFRGLASPVKHAVKWFSGDRPSNAVRLLEDTSSPDNRREGMVKMAESGFLHHPIFVKRCRQIVKFDSDFTVRATAIRTANRARDTQATSLFIAGLTDSNEWIRLEAAKALANVPDVNAAPQLVAMLNDTEESRDVRVAAADALKHYKTLPVARALSSALHDRMFVVAWQARQSLKYLTGRDHAYDEGAWLAYFTGPEKPLD